jgi:hypothetical protein
MRRGGIFLAVLVVISGVLRVAGPQTSASSPESNQARASSSQAPVPETPKAEPKDAYLKDLEAQINSSYGVLGHSPSDAEDLAGHLGVPEEYDHLSQREAVRFVIAILPNPAHTRLALLFDRGVEAIQQAAQRKGYFFERATMPWARTSPTDFADFESRRQEAAGRNNKEQYPGLLIFSEGRKLRDKHTLDDSENGQASRHASYGVPLFVFVVGETPTGGLNKTQFRNALEIIKRIRGRGGAKHPALILGPSFSGSLVSLSQVLPEMQETFSEAYVYSGTVTDRDSEDSFEEYLKPLEPWGHFLSFQENDVYLVRQFVNFLRSQTYEHAEIAVLSEDDTAYGYQGALRGRQTRPQKGSGKQTLPDQKSGQGPNEDKGGLGSLVFLRFPREISYFRSAYQKELEAQQQSGSVAPGKSTLTLDLGQTGSNDDVVPPYAATVTPASQEAVMLGIVGELQKHQIAFTVLFATDPIDELFMARYLRSAYPKGRVVVTSPDLLFAREQDNLLHGVLGLNTYPLVPGLDDQFCGSGEPFAPHEDRVLVSSLSVGTFNAMTGLLSATKEASPDSGPSTEFEEYTSPSPKISFGAQSCNSRPVVWLTILGRDGFWPIAGLEPNPFLQTSLESAEKLGASPPEMSTSEQELAHTPAAWSLAYCFCVFLMLSQFVLGWTGSILADSEARAQFANSKDWRHTVIVALGALCLCIGFVVLMCARNPTVKWDAGWSPILTVILWAPFFFFVGATIWELALRRGEEPIAIAFAAILSTVTVLLLLAAWDALLWSPPHWPTRVVAIASGASPILPALLLLAGGYWWMWQSLRGVTLIDLRRPRLPKRSDVPQDIYHVDDNMAEQVRIAAHPFLFEGKVVLPVVGLLLVAMLFVDLDHPVQTVEGFAYDIAYSALLGIMIATLLGTLLKLVWCWFKCRKMLAGLDRLPLREAFSRLKGLSWQSMWNPGGSTLRETYKIMSRALESLGRLELILKENDPKTPFTADGKDKVVKEIERTKRIREKVHCLYEEIVHGDSSKPREKNCAATSEVSSSGALSRFLRSSGRRAREAKLMPLLTRRVGMLQKQLARTAAFVLADILKPWWAQDRSPVVSEEDQPEKKSLPPTQILGEEYMALIYVNFLITVLLRMRTLVVCAAGLFVFIVLSVNVYPFEPHPALQTLCVILLVLAGAAVGFVYAGMHRDAVLSRLTSKGKGEAGELGWDFWLKFASAGAIPLFSLLASQFPSISQFLFSWLEPALQALK